MTDVFREGDRVLLVDGERSSLVLLDGRLARMKGVRGGIDTSRMVGLKAGARLSIGNRNVLLLRPDFRDLAEHIERGPQIIIPKDAAEIVSGLGLSNGSRVLEGGAGSGALTLFLLNAVYPEGMVITYDIREDHLRFAEMNIDRAGLSQCWEGRIGDVTEKIEERGLDAMVVDIPVPERAVREAASSLKIGGRYCSYVPTTNQMERTVLALREMGFASVEAFEVIRRPFNVKEGATRPVTEMLSHTGYLVFARWIGSP
ncbi:MAG: tRNA (adenine-N1)-methyltransferase [Thermoplasmatota archaeon]